MQGNQGYGIFASALMTAMPMLPVEEEGRLNDFSLRENFIVRVFCYHRWRKMVSDHFSMGQLVKFHTRHKYLMMAHSEKHLRELGRLVANAAQAGPAELRDMYAERFFGGLRRKATRRKHTNVLQHIIGYFKKEISETDKKELLNAIADYRAGLLPLVVPMTLVRHYVNRFEIEYIKDQIYLNPHPKELMLLNHV